MKILCAGLMVCDIMVKPVSPELFDRDHTKVGYIDLRVGGDAYNVASNLASLGIPGCLCSAVGGDGIGAFALNFAGKAGVDIRHVAVEETPTSLSLIMIQADGERHFVSQNGASQFMTGKNIPDKLLDDYDILYIGSACDIPGLDGKNMEDLLRRAKTHGMVTAMDVTGNPGREAMKTLEPSLKLLDFFLPSHYEAMSLTGGRDVEEAALRFLKLGVRNVVIKRGADGSMYISGKKPRDIRYFPAFEAEVVDATGAGDAFVAGFLAAYSEGYPVDLCIKIASLTGAECVKALGSSGNLKNMSHYKQLLSVG